MEKTPKTFAFRLAERGSPTKTQWKAREGAPIAGCTEAAFGQYRSTYRINGDGGVYC